jgi:hypothetical protein
MRHLLTFVLVIVLAGSAAAIELGPNAPAVHKDLNNLFMDGAADREGGDDMASAVMIAAMPFNDTGATCDNTNAFDVACPYTGSTSADVWYSYTPASDEVVSVDLWGSAYDTKTYVLDAAYNVIACNDDFYSDYTSFIAGVALTGGTTYYFVVDGYFGACGSYVLNIAPPPPPCELTCDGVAEGEPENAPGYVDEYNSGCNGLEGNFQALEGDEYGNLTFCGRAGWNDAVSGSRDTDWFLATFGPTGIITIGVEAELGTYFFELGPQDCASVAVIQNVLVTPCSPDVMVVSGTPGSVVWLWAGPDDYYPTGDGTRLNYTYTMTFSGLDPGVVATESTTFDSIKSMYR